MCFLLHPEIARVKIAKIQGTRLEGEGARIIDADFFGKEWGREVKASSMWKNSRTRKRNSFDDLCKSVCTKFATDVL